MAKLIGLIGFARAGKTTVAGLLAEQHGFERQRFAGPLKDMLRAIGLTDYEIEGAGKEAPCDMLAGRSPRYAMQTLGAEWGRGHISPSFWTELAARRIAAALDSGRSVVVEDCRYVNEADAIRALGGRVWRVERPGIGGSDFHSSEREHLNIWQDVTLYNERDLDELAATVAYAVEALT